MLRRSVFADRLLEFREFAFIGDDSFSRCGAWREFFAPRIGADRFDGRVIFEIGCNDASLLAKVAARHPGTAFVGIDWKYRALHAAAERVAAAGQRNVALLHGRGQDIGRIFGDGELDEVWLFHPDPCDKPHELRNRLLSETFLLDVHRVLCPGGALAFKHDHAGYYQWLLALLGLPEPACFHVARAGGVARPKVRRAELMDPPALPPISNAVVQRLEVTIRSDDFWNDPRPRSLSRLFAGEVTPFERRAASKRYPIYYVELTKRASAPQGLSS